MPLVSDSCARCVGPVASGWFSSEILGIDFARSPDKSREEKDDQPNMLTCLLYCSLEKIGAHRISSNCSPEKMGGQQSGRQLVPHPPLVRHSLRYLVRR